jgi:hypothetical protein
MRSAFLWIVGAALLFPAIAWAQAQQIDSTNKPLTVSPQLLNQVSDKTGSLNQQLSKETDKAIQRLQRREDRLRKKLFGLDSSKASSLYAHNPDSAYTCLLQKFRTDSTKVLNSMGPEYLPYADSLKVGLAFLQKNPQLFGTNTPLPGTVQQSLNNLTQLETKLQDADIIKQYVAARQTQYQAILAQYSNAPGSLNGLVQGYEKEAYYYAEQVREYRQALNDPDKIMKYALAVLNKVPAFSAFMQKNSFLSGIFGVPSNYGDADGMTGLQSRDQVLAMIQGKLGQGGSGGTSVASLQQSLQNASQDIGGLQNKLGNLGGGSEDMDMPNFKPNDQKTKTLWQRLEYGVNIQTTQGTLYFPSYTDFGLSIAYKLGHDNDIGVGASYKVGWGTGFDHIAFSSEGAGLRSFVDIKIKKSFSLTGGYELNYLTPFNYIADLKNLSNWSQSGLIGVSKKISLKSSVFKKTQLQLLWDFLSYEQIPKTQPIIFRIGYTF